MSKEQLDALFTAMWPNLDAAIAKAVEQAGGTPSTELVSEPERTAEDMLGELVERVRHLEREGAGDGPLTEQDKAGNTSMAIRER